MSRKGKKRKKRTDNTMGNRSPNQKAENESKCREMMDELSSSVDKQTGVSNEAVGEENMEISTGALDCSLSSEDRPSRGQTTDPEDKDQSGRPLCVKITDDNKRDGAKDGKAHAAPATHTLQPREVDEAKNGPRLQCAHVESGAEPSQCVTAVIQPQRSKEAEAVTSRNCSSTADAKVPKLEKKTSMSVRDAASTEKPQNELARSLRKPGVETEEQANGARWHCVTEAKKPQHVPKPDTTAGQKDAGEEEEMGATEAEEDDSDLDLYRGADEIEMERAEKENLRAACTGGDKCSVDPAVNLLSYSKIEWRGRTARSALIKKGYEVLSRSFGSLRRVRGDNYCALRATLFQVFSQNHPLPTWLQEDDITQCPEKMMDMADLIEKWRFPVQTQKNKSSQSASRRLKHYLQLLKTQWEAAVQAGSTDARHKLCERLFCGGEEEYGLLEALKLLMLHTANKLHSDMQLGHAVPVFCWLLFARDSSGCPRAFLANHLQHVGFSGGLEQVEMFLLGYTLHRSIQVYRLYKAGTEEFITHYPDDHREDWPCVCLVTEDDRHYNIPVGEPASRWQPKPSTAGLC